MSVENSLSAQVGDEFRSKGLYLVTAESCTGGLLAHLITEIAGSSEYYLGGFVTYANQAKVNFLNVLPETLETFGAVSDETVREMAVGAREAFKGVMDPSRIIGVAISGIAGPGGGTPAKPVGTVWIGISWEKQINTQSYKFNGNRTSIKTQSAVQALSMILAFLSDS